MHTVYSTVKSGKFGQSAKFGHQPCFIHILIIGMKKQTQIQYANSENPDVTAHSEPSHPDFHYLQMYVRINLRFENTPLYPICSKILNILLFLFLKCWL